MSGSRSASTFALQSHIQQSWVIGQPTRLGGGVSLVATPKANQLDKDSEIFSPLD
jgi:hypothetical protein